MDGGEASLAVTCDGSPLTPAWTHTSGDTQAAPVSFSSQRYLVSCGGELVVRAGDCHRGMLRLPGISHCACHHLLQSHQEVSVHPALEPEGTLTGLRAPPPTSIRFCFLIIKIVKHLRSRKNIQRTPTYLHPDSSYQDLANIYCFLFLVSFSLLKYFKVDLRYYPPHHFKGFYEHLMNTDYMSGWRQDKAPLPVSGRPRC